MHRPGHALMRPAKAALAVVFAFVALFPTSVVCGQPTETSQTGGRVAVAPRPVARVVAQFPGARASLDTSRPSVAAGEPFGFRVRVEATDSATQAWVRFRLLRSTGRLIYQRTRVLPIDAPASVETYFERQTADLALSPGVYPVEVTIAITGGDTRREATLSARLMVYDQKRPRLPVVFVARVSGQPLSDPQGRFVADPGRFTRARDDARELAGWVLANPHARLTMSVSPLLLEEWRRISEGYEFVSPEGLERVSADEAVPRAYADALQTIAQAARGGRLELVSTGYADPSLSDITAAGMTDDVLPQYEQGLSATFAALETTPSTGTVPAGDCVPGETVAHLVRAGVRYAVVNATCTRVGDTTATPTSHRSRPGGLTILVADDAVSSALQSGDTSRVVALAFARATDEKLYGPLVITSRFGPGGLEPSVLTAAADELAAAPWAGLRTGAAAVRPTKRTTRLLAAKRSPGVPTGYWQEVNLARRWADALQSAVGEGAADAVTARRDSLIAQAAAWADPDGSWAAADRGRAFAATAKRYADLTLGSVRLALQPITLSGPKGNVPVTIRNSGERPLQVTLRARTSGGARIAGSEVLTMSLGPAESFTEIPVDLRQTVSSRLTVDILAGDVVVDSRTVEVRASYLDRIATIGGVVTVLGVLLAFIIRRVRSAEGTYSSSTS